MWCPEGYLTLSEIVAQFQWDSDLVEAALNKPDESDTSGYLRGQLDSCEYIAYTNWTNATIFSFFREKLRVCLTSGAIVRFQPSIYWWYFTDTGSHSISRSFGEFPREYAEREIWSKIHFKYVDIESGTIRSETRDSTIAPLSGCPLCLLETDLPVPLEELPLWTFSEIERLAQNRGNGRNPVDGRTISQLIVEAFESGKVKTKPDAKQLLGRQMKHDEWRAHWREACIMMPALSRPGPR